MKTATLVTLTLATLFASACSNPTAAPTPVEAVTQLVADPPAIHVSTSNDISINVGGENGTIPCDWAAVPACGRGAFASCVQHGVGTGQPGPLAIWERSEWQCFPESFLPGRR